MKVLKKITSFSLALLVLAFTLSFTVDQHYCGDFLVDISFTGDADGCGMNMAKTTMNNCCSDEEISFEGQDDLQYHAPEAKTFASQTLFIPKIENWTLSLTQVERKPFRIKEFPPPDIPRNYQSEYQVYII